MDNVSDTQPVCTDDSLAFRRLAKGYSLEDLAITTGLTIAEIIAAENGNGADNQLERIVSVLK